MVIKARDRDSEEKNQCGGRWKNIDAGTKISKVCYIGELEHNVDVYLTGTWDEKTNKISLWNVYYGNAKVEPQNYFKRCNEIVTNSSINDIFYENEKIVAGLESGDVEVCNIDQGKHLQRSHTFRKVHGNFGGSTSVCIVDGEIISGSDDGSLMRMDLATTSKPSVLSMQLNSVKSMAVCGTSEFVSGHGTGQIHLWDVRQINPAMSIGELPIFSKAVSSLTDTITALASHPSQQNVIGFGTLSGSVGFVDVRNQKQVAPNLLKVSREPISSIKFHPVHPTNCFALSGESFLHLDLSTSKPEQIRELAESNDPGKSRANVWLTAMSWNLLDINSLLVDGPKRLSNFDLSPHSILTGSNTNSLSLLNNAQFY